MGEGRPDRVIVVGAGIAGLATAYRLLTNQNGRGMEVTILEASGAAGGKLQTGEVAGIPVEDGADSFVVRKPWALRLCRDLGLGQELVSPAPGGAYVWSRGRLHRFPTPAAFGIPGSIENLLRWRGLSGGGRVRALGDLLRPRMRSRGDESIMSLAARRLGPEAAGSLVAPLLAGVHAGDPDRLSVTATFPELRAWERDHGSLIRGAKAALKASRSKATVQEEEPIFATVWTGLSRLVSVLVRAIGEDRVNTGELVTSIRPEEDGWSVHVGGRDVEADALVLAIPAFEASRLLHRRNARAADELALIPYVSTAVATLVYPPGTLTDLPPGTGFIVPASGLPTVTACTFVSSKWPRAEHAGRAVVRCFAGRAGAEDVVELGDEELATAVAADVRTATGLDAEPEAFRIVRWLKAMPQYEVGHLDRLARIEEALERTPGLFLVGSAYRGVGIADCARQGEETAALVRAYLSGRRGPSGPGGRSGVEQEAMG
jgi:protoporphyrinogen/coproporphyrinogen III oxidase